MFRRGKLHTDFEMLEIGGRHEDVVKILWKNSQLGPKFLSLFQLLNVESERDHGLGLAWIMRTHQESGSAPIRNANC